MTTPVVEDVKQRARPTTKHLRCHKGVEATGLCRCGGPPGPPARFSLADPSQCKVCQDMWFAGHNDDCPRDGVGFDRSRES